MTAKKKNPQKAGRKSKYKPEFADTAGRMALLGLTDEEMASVFDVGLATLNRWKIAHPEFRESINEGRDPADAKVARALYNTALEGNTTAQIFWLKNRQVKKWRDKQEISTEVTVKDPVSEEALVEKLKGLGYER